MAALGQLLGMRRTNGGSFVRTLKEIQVGQPARAAHHTRFRLSCAPPASFSGGCAWQGHLGCLWSLPKPPSLALSHCLPLLDSGEPACAAGTPAGIHERGGK